MTLDDVKKHPEFDAMIEGANQALAAIGYSEHGHRHVRLVSSIAHSVLSHLGAGDRVAELAAIAGYLHDVGNVLGRARHGQGSAALVAPLLRQMGMDPGELVIVLGAIGNHEEECGAVISDVSAALILADKSDVHRTRVQNPDPSTFDVHDKINYAVTRSFLRVKADERRITLELEIEAGTSLMDYFDIFHARMMMCRRAAEYLGQTFELQINGQRLP